MRTALLAWLATALGQFVKLRLHPRDGPPPGPGRRRRRATARAAAAGAELYEGLWTHYVHLYVGTPPQKTSVIVDTGSSKTAFVCAGCEACGAHESPPFDASKSETYEARAGTMSASYSEGSEWRAQRAEVTRSVSQSFERTHAQHRDSPTGKTHLTRVGPWPRGPSRR